MAKQVTAWESYDGKIHRTREDAVEHERKLKVDYEGRKQYGETWMYGPSIDPSLYGSR